MKLRVVAVGSDGVLKHGSRLDARTGARVPRETILSQYDVHHGKTRVGRVGLYGATMQYKSAKNRYASVRWTAPRWYAEFGSDRRMSPFPSRVEALAYIARCVGVEGLPA